MKSQPTISHHAPSGRHLPFELERLFRKCSPDEAAASVAAQKLANGRALIRKGNGRNSSDVDKWVSRNPRFIVRYKPRDADSAMYRNVLVVDVKPGTLEAMKGTEVKKGPQGAYGLPPGKLEWFNSQIVAVSNHENGFEARARLQPLKPGFEILVDRKGDAAFFVAFPCNLLVFEKDSVYFGDDVKLDRMTWLKTSLLWTVWRSDFATKEGMDRLLQIAMPHSYLDYLVGSAVSTLENKESDEVIYQKDPDRVARFSRDPDHVLPFRFRRAGSTVHFGLKSNALLELFVDLSRGRISDITNTVQSFFFFSRAPNERISGELYGKLKLTKEIYAGPK
jgi:hypothetical protein